jgi:hypothetical protein
MATAKQMSVAFRNNCVVMIRPSSGRSNMKSPDVRRESRHNLMVLWSLPTQPHRKMPAQETETTPRPVFMGSSGKDRYGMPKEKSTAVCDQHVPATGAACPDRGFTS